MRQWTVAPPLLLRVRAFAAVPLVQTARASPFPAQSVSILPRPNLPDLARPSAYRVAVLHVPPVLAAPVSIFPALAVFFPVRPLLVAPARLSKCILIRRPECELSVVVRLLVLNHLSDLCSVEPMTGVHPPELPEQPTSTSAFSDWSVLRPR